MMPRVTVQGLLGTLERLSLEPETRSLHLLVSAPIALHATAIVSFGPDAETVRAAGVDPDPHCAVAVVPVPRPSHPVTDEVALARALLGVIETLQARGDLRAIAGELEQAFAQLSNAAREDRLIALARRGGAQ